MSNTVTLADVQPGDYLHLDSTSGYVDQIEPAGTLNMPDDPDHGRPLMAVRLDTGDGYPTLSLFADESYRITRKTA